MLGVRRLGGVQVDLYQGDPETFVCDARVPSVGALHKMAGRRHVMLVVEAEEAAESVMRSLKESLVGGPPEGLGRVTVVLGSLDRYWSFQDALFSLFPDEE